MKILFVGNSYTYFGEMPEHTEALLRANGFDATVHSVTAGGRKLYQNTTPGDALGEKLMALVSENEYDAVILQEQSYLPLANKEKFLLGAKETAKAVGAKRTLFYVTWGRHEGCELLDEYGWTRESMTEGLHAAYKEAAALTGGELSDVGKAFLLFNKLYPDAMLYTPDLSHPSPLGTSLGCAVHFVTLTKKLPEDLCALDVSDGEREMIREALKALYA
jgi:hypothetical protein